MDTFMTGFDNKSIQSLLYSKTLETFLAVCQHQNFTSAAKALGASQSAISQNIQKLEDALGVKLFDRDVRPIALRPEAILLRDQLQGQFADLENTVALIREQNAINPIARLGVIDSLSSNIAPALIRLLLAKTKRISVLSGISPNVAQDLLNRDVDIIITLDSLDNVEGLSRYFLCREPHVLVLPKGSPLKDKPLGWQQLMDYDLPLVRYSRRSASGRVIDNHFSRMRMSFPFRLEADTTEVMLSVVADGLGWALSSPLALMQCENILPSVHLQPAPSPSFYRDVYVVTRYKEYESLVETILQEATNQLYSQILPKIQALAPWVVDEIVIES